MGTKTLSLAFFVAFFSVAGWADQSAVVLDNTPSHDGSAVMIEKGKIPQWNEYQIIDGQDEIFGTPEYDRTRAYSSWKSACADWKKSMKEMNTDRQLLTLNCSSPAQSREGELITYKSSGVYKMRVQLKERK